MSEITLPTVHINGTHPDTLFEGYLEARRKLIEAEEALKNLEFNARDYYPVEGAWHKACEERKEWFRQIRKMQEECMTICEHIQNTFRTREEPVNLNSNTMKTNDPQFRYHVHLIIDTNRPEEEVRNSIARGDFSKVQVTKCEKDLEFEKARAEEEKQRLQKERDEREAAAAEEKRVNGLVDAKVKDILSRENSEGLDFRKQLILQLAGSGAMVLPGGPWLFMCEGDPYYKGRGNFPQGKQATIVDAANKILCDLAKAELGL